MRKIYFLGPVFLLCGLGCSGRLLSRDKAADLLTHSEFFKSTTISFATGQFCSNMNLPYIRSILHDPRMYSNDPLAKNLLGASLEAQGSVTLSPLGDQKAMLADWISHGGTADTCCAGCFMVAITPKGGEFVKNGEWKRTSPEGTNETYEAEIAKTELIGISGITTADDAKSATVEFDWKPVPTHQASVFSAIPAIPSEKHKGSATFQLYDDGWRVKNVNFM